ncbi:MAG TPA: sugar phosphate isomerase/epimerase, partial [Acidimicrobiales bacterium]|nr:sugar phosphate isomerase/epimerase [Acidimicrobiales bacterium]
GDLVLCSGTLPRGTSFAERLASASAAGFAAVSLWGRDYRAAREEGLSDADLRAMLEDHGLSVAELDPAWWWLPGAADVHIPPEVDSMDIFRFGEAEIFAIADAVGARSLNAVDVFGGDWTVEAAAEAFAGLCARASEHGLLVHLEWLPWSRIPDLATALEVVRSAGARNGGLNVDAWHFTRTATDVGALHAVPGDLVLGVQLDDGPAEPEADLMRATLHDRMLPGDGEFGLVALLGALRDIGCAAPVGVEVFSDELHALGPVEAARRAASTTRTVLEQVASR